MILDIEFSAVYWTCEGVISSTILQFQSGLIITDIRMEIFIILDIVNPLPGSCYMD